MKKGLLVAALLSALLLAGCGEFTIEEMHQIEEVDGMVYSFIVGKVEGNDDLLAQVLTERAQLIIVPGRHPYPGAAEEMGERYEIVRFSERFHEGALFYKVKFYRPSTGKDSFYNVVAVNTDEGWRIAQNTSTDEEIMRQAVNLGNGVMIHEYKGGE